MKHYWFFCIKNCLKLFFNIFQSEMTSLKESEATERIEWERKCRQRLDEEWKQQEDGLRERFEYDIDLRFHYYINF